ncbi:GH1 family beta-glucosidase [Thalassotalea euphylliae]|uniref:GH1 family beta-glucosidase n=1 Tax=Thalassotalea euphylliae TaxID=1655234 RepID=UPI0036296E72
MNQFELPSGSRLLEKNFTYGVATASFQIEGSADTRLPCIWDTFCATPGKIADNSNGFVACEHVKRWKEDVELIESLGVDAYRLSISWPRVMHQDGTPNEEGLNFYIQLLDALNAKNIKPYVTLYHWDLPQYLEDEGGWLNRETAYRFQEYTKLVVKAFGDRVYSYATFNEPFCSAFLGYEVGIHAPGKIGKEYGRKAAHHILLAHGLGMQVLNSESPNTQNGIVLNFTPCYANSKADEAATAYADDYINQWYAKPIFDKAYPDIIDSMPEWQKPDIHEGDLAIIGQPIDFLGINFYTRLKYVADEQNIYRELPPQEPLTDIGWEIYPQAFTDLLVDLNKRYDLPPVFITENGAAMADKLENGRVNDIDRVNYYQAHFIALHNAIEQGVNVAGYFAWSLMDNFEWAEGYLKRFGIVYVDYPTQTRTIKESGLCYKQLISSRK